MNGFLCASEDERCVGQRGRRCERWTRLGTGLLVWGTLLLCIRPGQAQSQCPNWASENNTVVARAAPGCKYELNIPYTIKSHVFQSTQVDIIDTRPPGATLEIKRQFSLIEDVDTTTESKNLPMLAILRWTPELEHAGFPREFPVKIASMTPECESNAHTIVFYVWKCEYCINDQESIHSIAARFKTHWTQIWSSNPWMESPDMLASAQKITLGNLYRAVTGDTWKLMAVRFGTTMDLLMKLNPDLADKNKDGKPASHVVAQGTEVCVMPETCPERRTSHPGITW